MLLTRNDVLLSHHVARRIAERTISIEQILGVLNTGEVIEPSLTLGFIADRPLHVATAPKLGKTLIITVYEPDAALWSPDFRKRLKP